MEDIPFFIKERSLLLHPLLMHVKPLDILHIVHWGISPPPSSKPPLSFCQVPSKILKLSKPPLFGKSPFTYCFFRTPFYILLFSKLVTDVVLVSLLLTLNIFHIFFLTFLLLTLSRQMFAGCGLM